MSMLQSITTGGKRITYSDRGSGPALVLLHGFTESSSIWNDFTLELEKELRVIAVDLPGHGQTDVFGSTHSMEFMAGVVNHVLDHLQVPSCVMIGHSMGGYVTLAFSRLYPDLLKGIGLFHSHAAADTEEGRKSRVRTLNIVNSDRTGFIRQFIPGLFAPKNIEKHLEEIEKLRELALQPPADGITAALRGMMERDDNTRLLAELKVPILFIAGKQDSKIPVETILQQAALPHHSEVLILGDAGHMGFIEEQEKTLQTIRFFTRKAFQGTK
jgi:pimeloyl-ACP methyl ester carboxylesterase